MGGKSAIRLVVQARSFNPRDYKIKGPPAKQIDAGWPLEKYFIFAAARLSYDDDNFIEEW